MRRLRPCWSMRGNVRKQRNKRNSLLVQNMCEESELCELSPRI